MRNAIAALPVRTLAERTRQERADRYQWALAPAVILLIVEMLLGGARAGRLHPEGAKRPEGPGARDEERGARA